MPTGQTRPPNEVQRRIFFYRIDAGDDANGRPVAFQAGSLLGKLDALPFDIGLDPNRYWDQGDGTLCCGWSDPNSQFPRMRLALIRRDGLPQLEEAGELTPLGLGTATGLADSIHIIFFPKNIIGSEANFYGPRISRLRGYCAEKLLYDPITIMPLVRADALHRFGRLESVRLFRLRIHRSYLPQVEAANESVAAALRATAEFGGAEYIEVTLQADRARRSSLGSHIKTFVQRLFENDQHLLLPNSGVTKLAVRGFDPDHGKIDLVDLLSDKLVAQESVITQDAHHRVLNRDSIYSAIERAYASLSSELDHASGMAHANIARGHA